MFPKALIAASTEPIMLAIIDRQPSYGYQIIQQVRELSDGRIAWTAGTLYPVLHRLETRGLIASAWSRSEVGRKRKYYRITAGGRKVLDTSRGQWGELYAILVKLWGPDFAAA